MNIPNDSDNSGGQVSHFANFKARMWSIWTYPIVPSWHIYIGNIVTMVATLALLTPAFVGYIGGIDIGLSDSFALSLYAIQSFVHLFLQAVFSMCNTYKMRKFVRARPPDWKEIRVALVVAGYRENPFFFRQCLESIRTQKYTNIAHIIVVIDGNDDTDLKMANQCAEVLGVQVRNVDFVAAKNRDTFDAMRFQTSVSERVCVAQPHRGKREALYTAFRLALLDPDVGAVITTDSDSILEDNVVLKLLYPLTLHSNVGGVSGYVAVWNTDALLPFIIGFRYWLSFNMERAAQSLFGCVCCCPGPMACYTRAALEESIEPWISQKFLGQKCTYGDDRHLSLCVLRNARRIVYTQFAVSHTDTPYAFARYLTQQVRWSKSFFREYLFSLQCIHLQFIWMSWELAYNTIYFFLFAYWIVRLVYFANIQTQAMALAITTAMSMLRAIYGAIFTRDARFLFYHLYVIVTFLLIIPSKISALLTMWDVGWGTRGEKASVFSEVLAKAKVWIGFFLWVPTLLGGFAYTIIKNTSFDWSDPEYRQAFCILCGWVPWLAINLVLYNALQMCGLLLTPMYKRLKTLQTLSNA